MLKKLSFLIAILLTLFIIFSCQQQIDIESEKAAIKSVIISETTNWANRNFKGWADAWFHEKYVLAMFPGPYYYNEYTSWDSLSNTNKVDFENNNTPMNVDITRSNWNIRIYHDGAWVTYIQHIASRDDGKKLDESREVRFLEKKSGSWKIVYLAAVYKSLYEQISVENILNNEGYKLLAQDNVKEAIKILKMNVKLHPQSSNVYDSLGEAYMKDDNKKLAIKNYKMSLELEPENDNAEKMLEKLK
jgi:tetratricopeptide (TPR) repeat protein